MGVIVSSSGDWASSGRSIGYLSDGTVVAVVINAYNLEVYYSTNDTTSWTHDTGATVSESGAGQPYYTVKSMAIDASNNIHLLYQTGTSVLTYVKLTKGGGYAWTPGSKETVYTRASLEVIEACDLDVQPSGVVAAVWTVNPTSGFAKCYARGRGLSNTWGTAQLVQTFTTYSAFCATVSRNSTAAVGGYSNVGAVFADGGQFIARKITFEEANGNVNGYGSVGTYTPGSGSAGKPTGLVFLDTDNNWIFVGVGYGPSTNSLPAVAMKFSTTAVTLTRFTAGLVNADIGKSAFAISSTKNPIIFSINSAASNKINFISTVISSSTDGFSSNQVLTSNYSVVSSGANRNHQNYITFTADITGGANGLYGIATNFGTSTASITSPANGATVTTSEPTLSATGFVTGGINSGKIKAQFQLADDSGFTVNDQIFEQFGSSGWSVTIPPSGARSEALQYIRMILFDSVTGQLDATGPTQTFTIYHPPAASALSPTTQQVLEYKPSITVHWSFTDPYNHDSQSAYQIVVERNSDGLGIYDSGKVTSLVPAASVPIEDTYIDQVLRYKVKLWDFYDVAGSYSTFALFTLSAAPTVTITNPTDLEEIATPNPIIEWTYASDSSSPQAAFKVDILKDNETVYTTDWIQSDVTSYVLTGQILQNVTDYDVIVSAKDSRGIVGSDGINISTSWVQPDAASCYPIPEDEAIKVLWTNPGLDADFYSWRVYRRTLGTEDWKLIAEVFEDQSSYEYDDWTSPANSEQQFAVVQVANRFGALVESEFITQSAVLISDSYWLIHQLDASLNMKLEHVTSDEFSEEFEESVYLLVGRGRHTDYGTRAGFTGQLSAEVRDVYGGKTARQQRLELELLKAQRVSMYLRNPFGDIWLVTLGDISLSRTAGVGLQEVHTVTIPYREVS